MKFFTAPALLAAALFSVVIVIPFLPMAKPRPPFFALEARIASSIEGIAKVYYDVGQGYSEVESTQQLLGKSDTPKLFRFPLSPANYRAIRFDPIDGAGKVTLAGPLRIVSTTGRVVRTIALSELQSLNQIESLREKDGRLEMIPISAANDPQLGVAFSPPLILAITARELVQVILSRALSIFAAIAAILFGLGRWQRGRPAMVNAGRWLQMHPKRAVALVAAAAVVASAYPVVFLGKSHVSPNFATTLLYEGYPTLPGYTSSETASGNGSDMGATIWQHVPYAFMQRRAIVQGEVPLWNRYNSAGTPLLAQGQSMFGDPLHFLVVIFNGASWAWDLKFLLAKFLFATGLGLTVLTVVGAQSCCARPEGRSKTAPLQQTSETPALGSAFLVTLAAPFVGFFLYRINHAAFFSLCYAPWVLYCWTRLAQAVTRRPITLWAAGLFVANLALMNSGTVKEAYLLMVQMNLTGACVLLVNRERWMQRLVKLAAAAWAGALLLLITAPLWATFLQTLRTAYTVSLHPNASQIQPSLLLGAFDELFFRPLSQGEIVFNPSLNFFLLLGLLYFLATLRLQFANRTLMAVATCTLVLLAFVFGLVPPRWIVQVPMLANVGHIENCFLCGLIVLWSVLAGAGFATAASRLRTPEGRGDLAIAGALLFALVFAWIGFGQAAHRTVTPGATFSVLPIGEALTVSPFVWGSLAILLVASLGLALVARRSLMRGAMQPGGVILAALCAIVLLWRHGMHVTSMGFERYGLQPPARARFDATSPAIDFVQARHQAEPGRLFGLHGNVTAGWNAVYGLEAVYGPDALQNAWLRQLIEVSPVKWGSSWRLYLPAKDVGQARPFLDALNVRYYLDLKSNQEVLGRDLKLARTADLDVYESPTAWPRAFFTDRLDTYSDPADLMKKFLARNGAPFASVSRDDVAKQSALQRLASDGTSGTVAPATNYRLTENTTSFKVRASQPGMVVLTEAWWPDSFRASVDGRRVPLVRVNHAFKGVLIDTAGDHHVTFWYWPRNFLRNLILCGIGVALLALSLFFALRPARALTA